MHPRNHPYTTHPPTHPQAHTRTCSRPWRDRALPRLPYARPTRSPTHSVSRSLYRSMISVHSASSSCRSGVGVERVGLVGGRLVGGGQSGARGEWPSASAEASVERVRFGGQGAPDAPHCSMGPAAFLAQQSASTTPPSWKSLGCDHAATSQRAPARCARPAPAVPAAPPPAGEGRWRHIETGPASALGG